MMVVMTTIMVVVMIMIMEVIRLEHSTKNRNSKLIHRELGVKFERTYQQPFFLSYLSPEKLHSRHLEINAFHSITSTD